MRISDLSSDVCSADLSINSSTNFSSCGDSDRRITGNRRTARDVDPLEQPTLAVESDGRLVAGVTGAKRNRLHVVRDTSRHRDFDIAIGHANNVFDRAFARRRSEEHTSELQSLMRISYAV